MLKVLAKYRFILYLLFFGGYGHLAAYTYHSTIITESVHDCFRANNIQHSQGLFYTKSVPYKEKGVKIENIEFKENEEVNKSFKNYLINDNYFSSTFISQLHESFFSRIKKISPFYRYFTYTPLSWNILFQVFRI